MQQKDMNNGRARLALDQLAAQLREGVGPPERLQVGDHGVGQHLSPVLRHGHQAGEEERDAAVAAPVRQCLGTHGQAVQLFADGAS